MDTVEVDVQHAIPLGGFEFQVADGRADSSDVGQGDDLRQLGFQFIDRCPDFGFAGDVRTHAAGLDSVFCSNFLGRSLAGRVIQVDDADVPTLGGQVVHRGPADAALGNGACDDGGAFSGESHVFLLERVS
ncbi:hypothetical protein NtRootA1_10200 [Arthrobacter sp. NtRootA1]|nr:hypothetical protein NtRootA1_10200 [Arthrobacter sp. NtRootA1]